MTTSVFADKTTSLYSTYDCQITMRGKLLGGIPKSPEVIEGWLRSRAGINQDEEIRQAMLRTLVELGAEVTPEMSYEQLSEASKSLAAVKNTNGFKRNDSGLYIEDRQIKAAIKEAVNILYAGERWGKTKKGPRNFTAERVFIGPSEISLGKPEPDGVELMMVHAQTPRGPMSSLSYHEYVEGAVFSFQVQVVRDEIEAENWPEIWLLCQENGIGACRSQSYGRFDVTQWKESK
jgi:hypothetical protein